jgi:hypothetical protein
VLRTELLYLLLAHTVIVSTVTLKKLLHFEVLAEVSDMPDVCMGPAGIKVQAVVMVTVPFSK